MIDYVRTQVQFRRGESGEAQITVDGGETWHNIQGLSNRDLVKALREAPNVRRVGPGGLEA